MYYMTTYFGPVDQAVFLLECGHTLRQTRLKTVPHASGYTAGVRNRHMEYLKMPTTKKHSTSDRTAVIFQVPSYL